MTDAQTTDTAARDYSTTLFLPQTAFPMRAGLPAREPDFLKRWEEIDLFGQQRAAMKGRARFVLHDGPPYANGHIHIGHALNKILKDLVSRSQGMLGHDATYVPGWDCHGLPIEWKIEEEYRAKGKPKPELTSGAAINAFRAECRAYATGWLNTQREEFKRLGVIGDWANPYLTMTYPAEAQIAREIMKFKDNGLLYRGSKPVMWSVVEKTALAEAEIEYHDHQSDMVWVAFPVRNPPASWSGLSRPSPARSGEEDVGARDKPEHGGSASIVIWTTTPWTLPGNRAISYSRKIAYGLYEVTANERDFGPKVGAKYILADKLADAVAGSAKITLERVLDVSADVLSHLICAHPLAGFSPSPLEGEGARRADEGSLAAGNPSSVTADAVPPSPSRGEGKGAAAEGQGGGYTFTVPLLDGDHVTDDAGTGFVHTAPGHGREDFEIWMANGRQLAERGIDTAIPFTVDDDSVYTDAAPGFAGKRVITEKGEKGDANEAVIKALIEAGTLVARGRLKHQYPHSWRSKKPVIFRNTPQWFIAMDKPFTARPSLLPLREKVDAKRPDEGSLAAANPSSVTAGAVPPSPSRGEGKDGAKSLRQVAFDAIAATEWVPAVGENRIRGMVENKPDWVMSRQRAWGVPLTVFVHRETKEMLRDPQVDAAIASAFEAEGADAWFAEGAAQRFLTPFGHDPAAYEMVTDVLDVWFDSGSTHSYVLNTPKEFPLLADINRVVDGGKDRVMYLEGSDQHRGWFQSSLLESCGTRGRAPFDVVLTHGFTMDGKGQKMSKSLGNVVAPQSVIERSGADILRLWVASVDYTDDQRISPDILKNIEETYRKLRNTIRWMLGTLAHFDEAQRVSDASAMPELERLMLHRLAELDGEVRAAYAAYDYKKVVALLAQFMNTELSAFYFDIRKDALYCDPASSPTRHAALTTVDHLFDCITRWLGPILVFTTEEAWLERHPDQKASGSIHLTLFPQVPASWRDAALAQKWDKLRDLRRAVTGALELERAAKRIGSSLEAAPQVFVSDPALMALLQDLDMAEICITSGIAIADGEGPAEAFRLDDVKGVAVVVAPAAGIKCARSWKYFDPATADPAYPGVTPRDARALREIDGKAA